MWSITTGRPISFSDRDRVGEVLHVDPELQVPAELLHHGCERPRRVERNATAVVQLSVAEEMIEAKPAHAERVPAALLGRRRGGIRDRDAAQAFRLAVQRIEHRRIIAAVRGALHQRTAVEAERGEQPQVFASGASGGV